MWKLRSSSSVLDSSAFLALLKNEPGSELVRQAVLAGASMSTVNLAEVAGKLVEVGLSETDAVLAIEPLDVHIIEFTAQIAYQAGFLRARIRHAGLSLGDRACLALARRLELPALTADRRWASLSLDVEVRVIR